MFDFLKRGSWATRTQRVSSTRWSVLVALTTTLTAVFVLALVTLSRVTTYDQELSVWQDAQRYEPENAEVAHNLGLALDRTGRVADAVPCYERALKLRPDYAAAYNNLANGLIHLGRSQEAVPRFEQALQLDPHLAAAHYNLGCLLIELDQSPLGIAHLEQALRLQPRLAEAHQNLGLALINSGRPEEAIPHFQQVVHCKPNFTEGWIALASAEAATQHRPQAVAAAEHALQLALTQGKTALVGDVENLLKTCRAIPADSPPQPTPPALPPEIR